MEVAAIAAGGAIVGTSFVFWVLRRCGINGTFASEGWLPAGRGDVERFIRVSDVVLAAYQDNIAHPKHSPLLGTLHLVKQVGYTSGGDLRCPPYVILVSNETEEVHVAVRGLHLFRESDYATFLRTWRAHMPLDGGLVHRGFLMSAQWLVEREADTLLALFEQHPGYTLVFSGHSLGAGVASLATMLVATEGSPLRLPEGCAVKCVAFAPPRVASQLLCKKHADKISSVILQDDFLPRTSIPVHVIMGAALCFPCCLAGSCIKDSVLPRHPFYSEEGYLGVPGTVYHTVYTHFCSCRAYPPQVLTGIPRDASFQQIVCSLNAMEDHSLVRFKEKLKGALKEMEAVEATECQQGCDSETGVPQMLGMEREP